MREGARSCPAGEASNHVQVAGCLSQVGGLDALALGANPASQHPFCGVAAEISSEINERAFDYLDAPVKRVSGADVPMPYAKNLEDLAIPNVDQIVAAVREVAYL